MENKNLITLQQFCVVHDINDSFILSLNEIGLIEVVTIEEKKYLYSEQLRDLEKMVRMHYELNINIEGIDTIAGLLHKIESMQKELIAAKNRLRLYEGE